MLHGFPAAFTKPESENKFRADAVFTVLPIAPDPPILSHEHEIRLRFPSGDWAKMVDETAKPTSAFHPKGMSGCGIWSFPDTQLVGILHSYDPTLQVVKGTSAPAFTDSAVSQDPALKKALSLITRTR